MKKKFSTKWKASIKPRKQIKYIANAPLHIKRNKLSAPLSKKLREKHKKRNIPLRKDDVVKVMRGEFVKKTGKVEKINLKNEWVSIEGIFRTKKDGSKIAVHFHPSNLIIEELNLTDKKRSQALARKGNVKKETIKENVNKEDKKNAPKKK